MSSDLQDLAKAAIARIGTNSSLEEIERAASVAKSVAETVKTTTESQNAAAQIRLERFKAWPSLAVPIVSLLTLLGTVAIQALQLHAAQQQNALQLEATRQHNEDTQWREFLKDVRAESDKLISDPTFVPRLKSFLHSRIYGAQVVDLAKGIMGSVANKVAFDEIFALVFPDIRNISTTDIVDLNRNLQKNNSVVQASCRSLSAELPLPPTLTSLYTDMPKYTSNLDDGKRKLLNRARSDYAALAVELQVASGLIANKLKPSTSVHPSASSQCGSDGHKSGLREPGGGNIRTGKGYPNLDGGL